jgi:hypothetical protein
MVNESSTTNLHGYQTEVPPSTSQPPKPPYPPTAFDYLALAPGLLVAATPLILGWLQYKDRDRDKDD